MTIRTLLKIWALIITIILISPSLSFAQEQVLIRGTVMDKDKFPLGQASMKEVDKDNRTITTAMADLDGNFSIKMANTKNKLIFNYIGFKEKVVTIGSQHVITVVMEENLHDLGTVTVTAKPRRSVGMLQIEDKDISMSVGRLSADEVAEAHALSIDDAIQGRIAGVDIVGGTGNPGGGMSIRIRGTTSLTGNNQPLIVVDGIPMENVVGASDFNFSSATEEDLTTLLNIAPTDISEIVVLKDAAATAIYGSKAASGVLQITTKRGTINPPKITYRGTFTMSKQPDAIPTLNGSEYATLISEGLINSGRMFDPVLYPEIAFDPNNPGYFNNYSHNTDWIKAVTQTGISHDHNLSVTGGTSKVRYRFSLGYTNEEGTTIETGMQRINSRVNLDYYISDKLRVSADVAFTHTDTDRNYVPNSNNDRTDVRDMAYRKMPNQSIYYYNERGERTPQYFTPENNMQGAYPRNYNPVAMAKEGKNNLKTEKVLPKFTLMYTPNLTWRYQLDVAFDVSNNKRHKFMPRSASGVAWNNSYSNYAEDYDDDNFLMQTFGKAIFTPQFKNKDHNLLVMGGFSTYDKRGNSYKAITGSLPSTILQDPSIPSRLNPNGNISNGSSRQRNYSIYGNANYVYKGRYIIYGSLRMDGDSRFGTGSQEGVFPALSGRYRLSGEPFMQKLSSWLTDLSFRGSWGMSGNTPRYDYIYYGKYSAYDYNYLGGSAIYPSSLSLDKLKWEKTFTTNLGANLILFDGRINVDFDYYVKTTKDAIMDKIYMPGTSGISSQVSMNSGTLENKGWELNVMTTPYKNKNWTVTFNFNVARNQNVIKKISEYRENESGTWSANGSYLSRLEIGQPSGSFYGYRYKGVYLNEDQTIARDKKGNKIYSLDANGNKIPVKMKFGYPSIGYEFQPGDAQYEDINNDGNIDYQDIVHLGDYNPLFFGGFGPRVRYKNITLETWFVYRYGNDVINQVRMNMENMYTFDNQSRAVLRRFRNPYNNPEEAPKDLLPRAMYKTGYNWLASDRFVEDGSFLRLKTVTLKYNFPKKVLSNYKVSDLSVWLTLQNLFTVTDYTGQDPEVDISGSKPGYDDGKASRPRSFTIGVNLTF